MHEISPLAAALLAIATFLVGNLTGALGAIAIFRADVRELRTRVARVERDVDQLRGVPAPATHSLPTSLRTL